MPLAGLGTWDLNGARCVESVKAARRFLVQRGISVVLRSKRPERIRENLAPFDFTLTDSEMERIRALDRNDTMFPWTKAF